MPIYSARQLAEPDDCSKYIPAPSAREAADEYGRDLVTAHASAKSPPPKTIWVVIEGHTFEVALGNNS